MAQACMRTIMKGGPTGLSQDDLSYLLQVFIQYANNTGPTDYNYALSQITQLGPYLVI